MKLALCVSIFFQLLIVNFQAIAQFPIKFQSITTKNGLAGDIVYALHQDKQGFLWIGTHHGLSSYDGYTFRLFAYDPFDTNSISGNHIHCIKEDADGVLWLATNKGLNSLDPISGKIKRYALPNPTMPMYMEDIFLVNDSIILISAFKALYLFNKTASAFTKIITPGHEETFSTDNAKFTQDNKGTIFIGSPYYDCVIINWENATAAYLPSRHLLNALPKTDPVNQSIRRVYIDAQNNAWCFNGAAFLSKSIGGRKTDYPYSNYPINSAGSKINSFFEEPKAKLWICTGEGLVLYDYANNSFYRYRQQKGNKNSLPFNTVTSMLRDRNGAYWLGTFGRGIRYFRLQPGFKNITVDSGSKEGERIVRIATPWFKSWWFFSLLLLFVATCIYLLFRYRLQQQVKLLQVRNRIHRDLHDDVGATLSSVKAYSEMLSNDPGNIGMVRLIKENATEMIEQLEVIAWAASPKYDSFGSFTDKINRYALPACTANNIQFHTIENGIERNLVIPGEIRQALYLIAKEAINNTNKYSAAKNCSLTAAIHSNTFTFEIRDDGKGFGDVVNGKGNGLSNMKERAEDAGGEIVILNAQGRGTTIRVSLPFPFKTPGSRDKKQDFH